MEEENLDWTGTIVMGLVFFLLWSLYVWKVDSVGGFIVVAVMYGATNFVHGYIMYKLSGSN